MTKILKNRVGNFLVSFLIFLIIVGWFFADQPRIRQLSLLPQPKEVKAAPNDVILFWDRTADPPNGWTCISCSEGDPYYEYFPRGATSAGGTASSTHAHDIDYVDCALPSSGAKNYKAGSGGSYPTDNHIHNGSLTATSMDPVLALPPYYELKVISSTTPSSIPAGAIAMFDNSNLPTNWATYTDSAPAALGLIIRGGPNASTTVSTGHTHSNVVFTLVDSTAAITASTKNKAGEMAVHDHSVSGGATDASTEKPPYIGVILAQAQIEITSFTDVIAMFDDTPSGNWSPVSAINSDKFIMASTTYNLTGGSATHTPANKAFNSAATGDTVSSADSVVSGGGALVGHIHSVTVSFGSESNLPPYLDTVFAKYSVATLSCSAIPSSVSFGTITTGSVKDADDTATTTITTNNANGFYLTIHDWGNETDPGLYGATTTGFDIIVSPNAAKDATATLAGGTEGYGIRVATTTNGIEGTLTIAKRYNTYYLDGFDADAVGGIVYATGSAISIASSSAAVTNREVVVTHKAAISGSTEAGDYKDTIVYTCALY